MSWLSRVFNVFRPTRVSHDLDREISFHIEEAADRMVERGMDRGSAMREAARKFGHRNSVKERTRDVDVADWLESVLADLKQAVRGLRATPGFALVAVLSIALGIGANTAIFSLIDTVILKSLPVARPDQLVKVAMDESVNDVFTNPLWEQVRDRDLGFEGSFAFESEQFNLAGTGQARMTTGAFVSGQFFSTLAIQPALGRLLQPDDDRRGCSGLAVLSYGFWQSEFGGARDVVGRSLQLNRQPFTVIGVAQKGFTGVEIGTFPQVYLPLCSDPLIHGAPGYLDGRSTWWLQVIARVPEGTSIEQVAAKVAAASPAIFSSTLPPNWGEEGSKGYLKRTLKVYPAANGFSGVRLRYQTVLAVMMGVVGMVLLIACANVANLLMARAAARQREIAMRLAIGASRGRIIRQVLTESVLLSLIGAGVGLLFARWSTGALVRMIASDRTPVALDLALDSRLLLFTLLVSLATAILFGVGPAWRAVRIEPQEVLKGGGGSTHTLAALTNAKVLVVVQVGLSLVLVATAGLLLGTFRTLATSDPGFRPDGVILANIDWASSGLAEPARAVAVREMLTQLRASPGIVGATASVLTPVSGMGWNNFVSAEGYTPARKDDNLVWFNGITDRYFGTLGTPILNGRDFTDADGPSAPKVAIVNRSFARRIFGETNPIGRQIIVPERPDKPGPPIEIVGLVGDARYGSLRDTLSPTVYLPMSQSEGFPSVTFSVRRDASLTDAVARIISLAGTVIPNGSLQISTLSGQVETSLAREKLLATLSGFFGGLALLLALIGLYGTMAYNVTRRRKEIGIRAALGATRAALIRLVAGEAGRMIVAGLLLGGIATFAATRLVSSFLFGRTPLDPATLIISVVAVAGVALLAGALPAVMAVRQDPQSVLREE